MRQVSIIPPTLIAAYRNTTYVINEEGDSVFIGKHSPVADSICRKLNAESWVFITPYNPRSELFSKTENDFRMKELQTILELDGLQFSIGEGRGEGYGTGPSEDTWEPEKSVFVPGVSRASAIELGMRFEQYAVVFGEVGKAAELLEIPLRPKI